jgi:D-ribose pyranose/furanose isomerase RbsD
MGAFFQINDFGARIGVPKIVPVIHKLTREIQLRRVRLCFGVPISHRCHYYLLNITLNTMKGILSTKEKRFICGTTFPFGHIRKGMVP